MVTEMDIVGRIEIAAANSDVYSDILTEAAAKITSLREERYCYKTALEKGRDMACEALTEHN